MFEFDYDFILIIVHCEWVAKNSLGFAQNLFFD